MSTAVPPRTVRILAGGQPYQTLMGCTTPLERVRERLTKYAQRHGGIEIREEMPRNLFAPSLYDPCD